MLLTLQDCNIFSDRCNVALLQIFFAKLPHFNVAILQRCNVAMSMRPRIHHLGKCHEILNQSHCMMSCIFGIININTTAIQGLWIVYIRTSRSLRTPPCSNIYYKSISLAGIYFSPACKRRWLPLAGEAGFLPISAGKASSI